MTRPHVIGPLNGNIFAVLAAAKEALRRNFQSAQAEEMVKRATSAGSYEEALGIILEYVDFSLENS